MLAIFNLSGKRVNLGREFYVMEAQLDLHYACRREVPEILDNDLLYQDILSTIQCCPKVDGLSDGKPTILLRYFTLKRRVAITNRYGHRYIILFADE